MDSFSTAKKCSLSKKDKSKKGAIDKPIKELVDKINKDKNYYTTSSCSGRIVLWIEPESGKKKDVSFMFTTHSKATIAQITKALAHLPKNAVWMRFEPMILHVGCKTMDDANRLLDNAHHLFKHSGIITAKGKIIVEVRGSEFIEALIAKDHKLLVSSEYLKIIISKANKKLDVNKKKMTGLAQWF